jgi:hypothetical protein
LGDFLFVLTYFHALCSSINLFASCLFFNVVDDTHIVGHDVVWDSFVSIAKDVGFDVLREQTHVFMVPYF